VGKQNYVPNRGASRQHHHEPVDADPFPAGRRQTVFERPDVVFVHHVGFGVTFAPFLELLLETAALLQRIVQLTERVRHLEAADVQLEALDGVRVVGLLL
jgi:hypothetical protein